MAMQDKVQPLFKQCELCHHDKEETVIIAKGTCNDDIICSLCDSQCTVGREDGSMTVR